MENNNEGPKKSESSQIRSVAKALSILEYLATCQDEVPLAKISKNLGIAKSTVHGLISTLKDFGYIEQSPFTGNYKLGLRLFEIGNIVAASWDVRRLAAPFINQLVENIEETVHLVILDKGEVLYIDKREGTKSIRIVSAPGMRLPAHCTGVGKALLAYLPTTELKKIVNSKGLKSFTKNTITDYEMLVKELNKIREQGYAYDIEEIMEGLSCIAAPIFDYNGKATAAISVSGPSARMNDRLDDLAKMLCQTTIEISHALGYQNTWKS